MAEKNKNKTAPPEISPYIFSIALASMGIWLFYDGWLTTDPDMQEHLIFNRVGSAILLPWAVIDLYRTWRAEKEYIRKNAAKNDTTLNDS